MAALWYSGGRMGAGIRCVVDNPTTGIYIYVGIRFIFNDGNCIGSFQQKAMNKLLLLIISCLCLRPVNGQAPHQLELNREYKNIPLTRPATLTYTLALQKNGIYQFAILQQGIAVYYTLTTADNNKLYESNYPDDINGYERFEYAPPNTGAVILTIKRFEDPQNTDSGQISIMVKSLSKAEIAVRKQIQKELEPENAKTVTTIDIDHFWEAFDHLKNCKTHTDSVDAFQKLYLDKATNGMLDFVQVRDLTADKFVDAVVQNAGFYQSVRQNTYEAKKAEPVVEEVFARFKALYADFKPFKVCFAIGIKNTGGTVSSQYVLIGTEVTVSSGGAATGPGEDIIQKIKGIVAHESVHTQQRASADTAAINCPLLWQSIKEGACDFIAELVTGQPRNNEYGEQHEDKLWTAFKNELCNQNIGNWLYNGYSVKDKPADLGYFIGYAIAKEYYKNANDKPQAVIDIIGVSDPIRFLEASRYDRKVKR